MKKLVSKLGGLKSTSGQNFVEYALVAGFVAATAGAMAPDVASSISAIFSQVNTVMTNASSQGDQSIQTQSESIQADRL